MAQPNPQQSDAQPITAAQWMDAIFQVAISRGASDIFLHGIEALGSGRIIEVRPKLRIDSKMIPFASLDGNNAEQVINAIKQKAGISTGNLIAPQEGRYVYEYAIPRPDGSGNDVQSLDIRITMYPDVQGQFISMRIPPTGALPQLESLGFSEENFERFGRVLDRPGGLTVLAGPMGSGKTTTLYSTLMRLGGADKSVITVEDPKERTLPGAHQLEINNSGDNMTYERVLKSLLRVVMDVLLIGEIRDTDTASAAIRIASAGTRVLSSIHSNDPVTAIARVISYSGSAPVNVLGSISGIVSQRLIRTLHRASESDPNACNGAGCQTCNHTGFKGRAPVHEVLITSTAIIEAFINEARLSEISQLAYKEGMVSFHEDADRLLRAGLTTPREIYDVLGPDPNTRRSRSTIDVGEGQQSIITRQQPGGAPTPGQPQQTTGGGA